MHHHPYEIEINAAYVRDQVMALAEATRRTAPAPRGARERGAPPAPGWLRRGLGRRLIAAGERLAGPSVYPPATLEPAA